MKCGFYCDSKEALGIASETKTKPVTCTAEAEHILRLQTIPKNRCQVKLLYKRLPACQAHAEYLCNDAQFKWESLGNPAQIYPFGIDKDDEQLIKGIVSVGDS